MQVDPRLPDPQNAIAVVLLVLGSVCVLSGVAIALYAGWVVYLLLQEPKSVAIVAHLVELGQKNLPAVKGNMHGQPIGIELGEPLYWLLILIAGFLLVGIVASVAKALVSVGVVLLQPAIAALRRTEPAK